MDKKLITVTSPLLPNLDDFHEELKKIWDSKWITNNGSYHKKLEAALAEYGTITGMAMPIVMFPATFLNAVSGLLIPEFSRYYAKNDYKRIREVSKFVLVLTSLFSVLSVST